MIASLYVWNVSHRVSLDKQFVDVDQFDWIVHLALDHGAYESLLFD